MENGFLRKWPRISERQKMQFRKRVLLFSVFLVISIFIWLLNALSKNYTTQLQYPLVYDNLPEDRVLVGELPSELDLSVNALGYALLRYKIFRRPDPVRLSVSSFNLSRSQDPDENRGYLLTRYLRDHIARQLPSELQLLDLRPDTLYFQFAGLGQRRVPVQHSLEFQVDKSFTLKDGVVLSPDSITVSGPDIVLDTLSSVRTESRNLELLNRSFEDRLALVKLEGVEYETSRVQCRIELEKYTEVQLSIPVEVINLPDSLTIQTFPSKIRFVCNVGLSKYERVNSFPFRALVDYSAIREQDSDLEIVIPAMPDYLLSHNYSPRSVEFLISLK